MIVKVLAFVPVIPDNGAVVVNGTGLSVSAVKLIVSVVVSYLLP